MADLSSIRTQVLPLDLKDRAILIEFLLESLDPEQRETVDAAWAAEADRRYDSYLAGTSKLVNEDEVWRRLPLT